MAARQLPLLIALTSCFRSAVVVGLDTVGETSTTTFASDYLGSYNKSMGPRFSLFNKLLRCCRLRKHFQLALSLSLASSFSLSLGNCAYAMCDPLCRLCYASCARITECLLKSQLVPLAMHSSSTTLVLVIRCTR